MVSIETLQCQSASALEYLIQRPLNLYDSPACTSLATQAIAQRHCQINQALWPAAIETAVPLVLCEDQYPGWLKLQDLDALVPASSQYQAPLKDRAAIEPLIAKIVDYALGTREISNEYLWGGTIGPNLDCSGLVQRAYGSQGVWVPRDAYQQEAFCQPIQTFVWQPTVHLKDLALGDLIFFGTPVKATHVAIYLGDGRYIHSSGKEQGRNCIGIDSLIDRSHPVSRTYFDQLRGAGRVMESFRPAA